MLSSFEDNAIVQLCFYVPFLATCIFLSARHGAWASTAWHLIGILSVMRIVGGSLELATMSNQTSIDLLQCTGWSVLILVSFSLVDLVVAFIPDRLRPGFPDMFSLNSFHLMILIGFALVIAGSDQIGKDLDNGRSFADYTIPNVAKIGVGLWISGFGLSVICAQTLLSQPDGAISSAMRRLLRAVLLAAPFLLVRLVYSAMATYNSNDNFRLYSGSPNAPYYAIGVCTVMEIVAVLIFLVAGLMLPYTPRDQRNEHGQQTEGSRNTPASDDSTKCHNTRVENIEMAAR